MVGRAVFPLQTRSLFISPLYLWRKRILFLTSTERFNMQLLIDILLTIVGIKIAARVVPGELGKTANEASNIIDNGLKALNAQLEQVNSDLNPSKKAE